MSDAPHVAANVERFMGFAQIYDDYRPSMPTVIIDVLTQLAHMPRPRLVVDIGSGTGLSTRVWADRADEIIGIEPSDDMLHQAEVRSVGLNNIRYQKGFSVATGLPDSCADIVTISQALHWMEPEPTFVEVARLLRPGGVFAAIDNDPALVTMEADSADEAFMENAGRLTTEGGYENTIKKWRKEEHLSRIEASKLFRYTKEIAVHKVEEGGADRMVGAALSEGTIQNLLKKGLTEEQIGLPAYHAEVKRILGDSIVPWYFTYRVRIGVK